MPTRITCIRCRFFIETEPKPGESQFLAAQVQLEDALDEGWEVGMSSGGIVRNVPRTRGGRGFRRCRPTGSIEHRVGFLPDPGAGCAAQDDGPFGKPDVERLQEADVARTRLDSFE